MVDGGTDTSPPPPGPGRRWTPDDRLVLVGTVLLLITLPMPWYRTDVAGRSFRASGWEGPGVGFTLLAVACALGLSALVLGRLSGTPWAERLTARAWWIDGVLGGGCLALLAGRLLWDSTFRSYGLVLGLLCGALVAFGGGAASLARWRAAHPGGLRAGREARGPARDQGSTQPPAPPPEPAGAPRG
jgi:hypothetical protein